MNEQELLEKAIAIATDAHKDQKDRYGVTYILHPLRVMERLETHTEKMVGVLHDVVEDTDWTFERLNKEGFPQPVIEALKAVTKQDGEDYEGFVKRSGRNPLAAKVKLADLADNMDLRRMPDVTENDLSRLKKYVKAWRYLKAIS